MQYYALSDRLSAVWLWCVLYSGSCLLLGVLPVLKRLDDHAVKTTVERIPFEERKGYLFTKVVPHGQIPARPPRHEPWLDRCS